MTHESRHLHLVGATGKIRTAKLHGRDHVVVPVTALVEGVLFPVNAETPELVLAQEFSIAPQLWNNRPVFCNHPSINGQQVSGNLPSIIESSFGQVFNARIAGKKLLMDAYLDPEKAKLVGKNAERVVERVCAGETVEVSVGVFVNAKNEKGEHNGKKYAAKWLAIQPDHLAILPEGVIGACSVAMGCGTHRAAAANDGHQIHVLVGEEFSTDVVEIRAAIGNGNNQYTQGNAPQSVEKQYGDVDDKRSTISGRGTPKEHADLLDGWLSEYKSQGSDVPFPMDYIAQKLGGGDIEKGERHPAWQALSNRLQKADLAVAKRERPDDPQGFLDDSQGDHNEQASSVEEALKIIGKSLRGAIGNGNNQYTQGNGGSPKGDAFAKTETSAKRMRSELVEVLGDAGDTPDVSVDEIDDGIFEVHARVDSGVMSADDLDSAVLDIVEKLELDPEDVNVNIDDYGDLSVTITFETPDPVDDDERSNGPRRRRGLIGNGNNQYTKNDNSDKKIITRGKDAMPGFEDKSGDVKAFASSGKKILGSTAKSSADGTVTWSKRGGHPNAKLELIKQKLEKSGFKENRDVKSTWSGDGEKVRHDNIWQHKDGRVATMDRYYGETKDYNSFDVTIYTPEAWQRNKQRNAEETPMRTLRERLLDLVKLVPRDASTDTDEDDEDEDDLDDAVTRAAIGNGNNQQSAQQAHDESVDLGAVCSLEEESNLRAANTLTTDARLVQDIHNTAVTNGATCDHQEARLAEVEREDDQDAPRVAALKTGCGCGGAATAQLDKPNQGDIHMDKATRIKALISHPKTVFTAADQSMLEAASDERLTALAAGFDKAKMDEEEAKKKKDEEAKADADKFAALSARVETAEKPKSETEWLQQAPESIRTLVSSAQAREAAEKTALVTSLKTAQSAYTEEELNGMTNPQLLKLAQVAKVDAPKVDFSGIATPRVAAKADDNAIPAPPDMNERIRVAAGKGSARVN